MKLGYISQDQHSKADNAIQILTKGKKESWWTQDIRI